MMVNSDGEYKRPIAVSRLQALSQTALPRLIGIQNPGWRYQSRPAEK